MTTRDRTAHALIAAFDRLRDPEGPIGTSVRRELVHSTGLTPAMIEWGLRTSLPSQVSELLDAIAKAPHAQLNSPKRVAVILAGNVFTACIRALCWPLLLDAQVTAKASSHDDVLPRALMAALHDADPVIAQRLRIATFDRDDASALQELLNECDVVSVYGSDSTIDAVSSACPDNVRLLPHGHGVSAMFVSRSALRDHELAQRWAEHAALSVAAYDQRGCLSPHVIWVETGAAVSPAQWAALLADALSAVELSLPRGRLPEDVAVAQAQWRGVRIACADLLEGASFSVAIDDAAFGVPSELFGPGYRNVMVRQCVDDNEMWSAVANLGAHLKALGVAGDARAIAEVVARMPSTVQPHVTLAGEMQTPAFDAPADGKPAWFGLR